MVKRKRPGPPLAEGEVWSAQLYGVRDQLEEVHARNPDPTLVEAADTVVYLARKFAELADPQEA
jgi:hypothetical protein